MNSSMKAKVVEKGEGGRDASLYSRYVYIFSFDPIWCS